MGGVESTILNFRVDLIEMAMIIGCLIKCFLDVNVHIHIGKRVDNF
jgi:hypothetical protein